MERPVCQSETLRRTASKWIAVAGLVVLLDDEDEKSFADLTSKGMTEVRGGAWRREPDGRWRLCEHLTGRMMIEHKCRDVRFGPKAKLWHGYGAALGCIDRNRDV